MEPSAPTNQIKQIRQSIFINGAMAVFAVCTLINALLSGEAWRIVMAGVGSVFFIAIAVRQILKLNKLRKAG
jgi:hypothetical protein